VIIPEQPTWLYLGYSGIEFFHIFNHGISKVQIYGRFGKKVRDLEMENTFLKKENAFLKERLSN